MNTQKQPFTTWITWKSFLVSAVIILVLYLIVNAIIGGSSQKKAEARISGISDTYTYKVIDGNEDAVDSILSIPVHGIILTEQSTDLGFFDFLGEEGATYGYDIKDQLKRAAEDKAIKAVVLEINSPGGTIPGAHAIAAGVAYYREVTKNPVYTHISDMAASGGYWAAASTDFIAADPGSTIGSIGVIMGPFKHYKNVISENGFLGGVDTEGGIENRFFTAGHYKDTGSPYRAMSPDEEKHWQTALNNEYTDFVAFVSARRGLSPEDITTTIKALPYETNRALTLGLIDETGSKEYTYSLLAQKKQLEDFNIIQEETALGFFADLLKGAKQIIPQKTAGTKACSWCNGPLLLYDRSYMLP